MPAGKLLLHVCCGPCSIMTVKRLLDDGYDVTAWYMNPNIQPLAEYLRRREAAGECAERLGVPILYEDETWDVTAWLRAVRGRDEPPARCHWCCASRVRAAFDKALALGFENVSTSLLYSRYQPHDFIAETGRRCAEEKKIAFVYRDFREYWQDGIDISKEWGIYRQPYCGCVYSEADRYARKLQRLIRAGRAADAGKEERAPCFHSYDDIAAYLDARGCFHMDMSLGRMEKALARLGLRRPPFRVVQVIGTNGKGSTSSFLASICRAHGLATGLYTSPHFVEPTERIQINGVPVSGREWVEPANRVLSVAQDLTYFEFLTVLALLLFQKAGVDIAVLEAGLGGRHDATTAVDADLLCFTPIAMDHCDVLGDTLEAIARDKADAMRGGAAVCSAPQTREAGLILREKAREAHAPLAFADELPEGAFPAIGLAGGHQRVNAGLALAAWRVLAPMLGRGCDDVDSQGRGIAEAFLPGRFQRVRGSGSLPPLVLDGAHNPHGTQALAAALKAEGLAPSAVMYSCLRDKDWRASVTILSTALEPGTVVFVPQMENPRAEDAGIVASFWNGRGCRATPVTGPDAVSRALKAAFPHGRGGESRPVLLTGSLYLLSAFFALHPRLLSKTSCGGAG